MLCVALIALLLALSTYASILLVVPSGASVHEILSILAAVDTPIVSTLSCNQENAIDLMLLDAGVKVGEMYFSRLLCSVERNQLISSVLYSDWRDELRVELIRPSVANLYDFDVVMRAFWGAHLCLVDSEVLSDAVVDLVHSLHPSVIAMDATSTFNAAHSTLKIWKHVPVPRSDLSVGYGGSSELSVESADYLSSVVFQAHECHRRGDCPDVVCNCGDSTSNTEGREACFPLATEALQALQYIRVQPHVEVAELSPAGEPLMLSTVAAGAASRDRKKLLLCMVYTISPRHDNLRAIVHTWGKRCDGFIAWSNTTDPELSAVHIFDVRSQGEESYEGMWHKVINIWKMVADSGLVDQYDYFYLCGDDVYTIVENLRSYLTSDSVVKRSRGGSAPVYLGRRVWRNHFLSYATGEAGYVLNSLAVKMLVRSIDRGKCLSDIRTSMEDIMVANCLRTNHGIEPIDTRDDIGRERFHVQNVSHVLSLGERVSVEESQSKNIKFGREAMSDHSIAFHLMTPNSYLYCIHDHLYNITP